MRRLIVPLVMLLLVVAGCSGDDDSASTTETAPTTSATATATTTTQPATTSPPATTTTTTTVAETTTGAPSTTTTAATIAAGPGVLAMTRVVFEPGAWALVTNVGGGPIDLAMYWMCQRPAYVQLPSFEMQPGDTVAIGLGDVPPDELVGVTATFDLGSPLGAIVRDDGELGLYTAPLFDDPNSLGDYVEWGTPNHGRSSVAVAAGIWDEGAFVEVPIEALSISSSGLPAAGFEDWFADVGG